MVRPARKLRQGEVLLSGEGAVPLVRVEGRSDSGDTMIVSLVGEGDPLSLLQTFGEMPLPPYIETRLEQADRYQTVYANEPASAAAPTAGLHFTPELLERLRGQGVRTATVELVVGLDTFKPVSADDPREHSIHSERYRVPAETLEAVREARRVVAVGTTSVRALESAAATGEAEGRTRLFIHRPYEWRTVDVMMTNFHMPRTTLLMMIDAFVGSRWRRLYEEALAEQYRFFSFGDAMLLDRSLD
jgi:S-adenosylmethionine:tRNA ribosyltransferase-isomerase